MSKQKTSETKTRKVKWNDLYERLIQERNEMLDINPFMSPMDVLEQNSYKYITCEDFIQIIEGYVDSADIDKVNIICDYEPLLKTLYGDWIKAVDTYDDAYQSKYEFVIDKLREITYENRSKKK